ncbi:flagellar biogenesis protein FliO [Sphingomonas histidinilytica]|jgi:flagellar protein FliO/FliZ|uniref:Flagellar protein FliO/FliZ n=1 Tax=Rhizorhabdus histidinilytica TaxID=439228 RepID=A0A1T5G5W3_9SPHN|nr:flagellar biosynthetic protein FliO [Rhizorhabdus histidinilytica]MBO9375420.1 flagellar biogenesis protein FliO [Rhizorhabdus histidinilytica]QEH77220.1 FliO/MopB family protein [Sphingomonas sp. C8-2]SKC03737.1 flagellar protein FliO/FliZ [Rhizorhabdus histidinilytica]
MMLDYLLRLLLLVPLVAGLAYGSLWLWRKLQPGIAIGNRDRAIRIVDAIPMGATGRLAVVEFANRHILVAVSRGRIEKIAEAPADGAFVLPDEDV